VKVRVELALPLAGGVTGFGEKAAVTPEGKPVALRLVAELKPFKLVMVVVLVPVPPCATFTEVGEVAMEKSGAAAAVMVSEMVAVWVSEPEVPVTVTVAVPVVAVEDAVSVSVDVAFPLAGGVTGFVEKPAVTPLGNPEALSVVAALNPFKLVTVTVLLLLELCATVSDDGEVLTLKFGGALTVRVMVAVCVVEPEVPVTVTVAVPVVAVEEAVRVSVEVAVPLAGGVTGFGENAAVTPLGNPEAVRLVAALKPFKLVTVMVLFPLEPWVTVSDEGEAATLKSGVGLPPQVGNLKFAI